MDSENTAKKVLITGCSSGFGLLTAVKAAQSGFNVIATMRNPKKFDNLKSALEQAGATATIDILDITKPESITEISQKYAPIDILVNNAGILMTGSFLDITEEEERTVFETNYFGPVALARQVARQMIPRKQGLIINIASLAGRVGHPFNAAYAASKHALVGFSRSISLELQPFNIKVVSVEPGYHKTEIIRANANLSENFYDRTSPMFDYNQGFLQLMFDEIVPKAGSAENVADIILHIMQTENPKAHYVIGKDAKFATTAFWLGLGPWLKRKVARKLARTTRRVKKKTEAKKQRKKDRRS